jgi:hypothetical protein
MKFNIVFAFLLLVIGVSSCDDHNGKGYALSTSLKADSMSSSCANFTKDNKGNIVLSWVRQRNDSSSIFCYAVSADKGKSFGRTIEIPSSTNIHPHAENIPKLIFKPSGEIIAVWGAANPDAENKYAGLVYYSQSFDSGSSWTEATRLVKDTAGFDQRYFDIVSLPDGEVGIGWLDNRIKKSKDGSALYFARTNGKNGFTNERLISEPACECCRIDLFADSKNALHITFRAIIRDSIRDILHTVSNDNGQNFSEPVPISADNWVIKGCPHTGPSMTEINGEIYHAWYTMGTGSGIFSTRSGLDGNKFTPKQSISGRSARHPQVQSSANNILMVWDETFSNNGKYSTKIEFQRTLTGDKKDSIITITPEFENSSYPVLYPIDERKTLVAYTRREGDQTHVCYQSIELYQN